LSVIERIVELLDARGISQKEICEKTDIKPQTFSTWKKQYSNVPIDKLVVIADYLQVSLSYLVTGEGSEQIEQLSEQEEELFRIFKSLNMKNKTALLSYAYKLEEENT
jgi:transcriptional regulator with XRE-family HTH domain